MDIISANPCLLIITINITSVTAYIPILRKKPKHNNNNK